jgi:hypothetical protein
MAQRGDSGIIQEAHPPASFHSVPAILDVKRKDSWPNDGRQVVWRKLALQAILRHILRCQFLCSKGPISALLGLRIGQTHSNFSHRIEPSRWILIGFSHTESERFPDGTAIALRESKSREGSLGSTKGLRIYARHIIRR